ncbi:hypothetical protein COCC4DRAFT_55440 [Bipolaris maydis ATCC 48331]|uniref:Uncharacterized protein n=2 Tax=Cochliobolus heterostrophus TaxID=5016 RepID=M2UBI4_COCH5|nr:uncharacterized protein COCC4DRAFT_55440 [Bipolaris maydis ATCC 48331]EMD95919.1 hypothetical protein COCHEDRAFT_1152010 [Bipolaris maydis C5]ENI10778.1 hypothetical protein COCC4DRAFT_55440 [Bipolaris maydis ATCC 48331]KAJ6213299.1 hypothetical protein PSV09DRAFT_1152010 [Bipolaris maydis]
MKLASPLACVGVFDFTFWFFFFQYTQPTCISLCLFVLCHCSLLRVARWIDIPSLRSLTAKLCRRLSLRQTCVQSPPSRDCIPPTFYFPLANIATSRRCITAATRLAVACPLAALHR